MSNVTETSLDDPPGARKNVPVTAFIDILAVAEALEESGMDTRQAHVCATQMHLVANAREAVTRPELAAALGQLKAELLERITQSERGLIERIAETERRMMDRMSMQYWRLVGTMTGLLGLAVAAMRYLP